MAFMYGPSYAQSLLGPIAPTSYATRLRGTEATRTTAANTRGTILCSASTIAVFAKPQALSPDGTMCVWRQIVTMVFQRKVISRGASTPRAYTKAGKSALIRAVSLISLPPVEFDSKQVRPQLGGHFEKPDHSMPEEALAHVGRPRVPGYRSV